MAATRLLNAATRAGTPWGAALVAWMLAAFPMASCGKAAQSSSVGSGGDSAAGGVPNDSPCAAPNAFAIWGKQYLPGRDCIDTEAPTERVACNLIPDENDPDRYPDPGFHCIRRLEDDAVFWAFAFNDFGFDAREYELCDNHSGRSPTPCFAAGCYDAPHSSCSLAQTRKQFACNSEGGYDESCCGRSPCEQDSDCEAGQECRFVSVGGMWECWDNPGNPCDCGGPLAAFMDRRCVPLPAEVEPLGSGCEGCTRRPIGAPRWEPVQAQAFAATIGSPETGPDPYFEWLAELYGPLHTYSPPEGFLPGVAHDGPYQSEISSLAEAAGLVPTQSFSANEFTGPSGVVLLITIAPGSLALRGQSPDFEDGPIIPNNTFPISVSGGLYRGTEPYDLDLHGTYVGYDQLTSPLEADGASHFFVSFGMSSAFGTAGVDPVGNYTVRLRAIDSVGDGWELVTPFGVGL